LSFELAASLRRLKPQKRTRPLARRDDADLTFVDATVAAGPPILLDTNVYIDSLHKRLPGEVKELLRIRQINHSSVAAAELAHILGRLDPGHPGTKPALAAVQASLEAIPPHRLGAPSIEATVEAGIVTGIVARLRGLPKTSHQPLLNDTILFLQALENGFCVLSRNIADLDFIQQIVPAGRVLFYRQTA
jgi:predicted nucleic acid-binding protein